MINESELKPCLKTLEEQHPKHVTRRLEKGSKVQKSLNLRYEIDDCNLDKKLGTFPEGAIPYGPIHRALRNSQVEILRFFNGSSEIPFSTIYEAGLGECLEKAILLQLSAQRTKDAYLINGCLANNNDVGVESHAYNVVFTNGQPFLIDVQNPINKDSTGKITHPYIAPILGIEDRHNNFVIPHEWKLGRTYSIH